MLHFLRALLLVEACLVALVGSIAKWYVTAPVSVGAVAWFLLAFLLAFVAATLERDPR